MKRQGEYTTFSEKLDLASFTTIFQDFSGDVLMPMPNRKQLFRWSFKRVQIPKGILQHILLGYLLIIRFASPTKIKIDSRCLLFSCHGTKQP